jgi:DNA-binding transcriptional regulator LsrR (DeoR family)
MAEKSELQEIATELTLIRKLLVFGLLRDGASQDEVAGALGLHRSSIGRMFPKAVAKGRKRG